MSSMVHETTDFPYNISPAFKCLFMYVLAITLIFVAYAFLKELFLLVCVRAEVQGP